MARLLSIGEFSKVSRLTIKALRLYDQLGLLPPARIDPRSGYRYYEVAQAPRARAIALLRSLDMPLADIQQVLAATDADKVRHHLDRHRVQLEDRLREHQRMISRVEHLIQLGGLMALQVDVQQIESITVCGIAFQCPVDEVGEESGRAYKRIYEELDRAGITPAAPPRLVYLSMEGERWTAEANVPIVGGDAPASDLVVREMPRGAVASAVHRGPYEELGMAYEDVKQWIEANGYAPGEPLFDIYLTDPAETPDPADYETQICWPIS